MASPVRKNSPIMKNSHVVKKWLYLTHRWIGIVSCLFFAMWFISGLVMVYVPFPSLEREDWLAGQQPIAWEQVRTPADEVIFSQSPHGLRELTLEMRGGEPVWRWREWTGQSGLRSAVDGQRRGPADADEARALAADFAGTPLESLEPIHNDQWTVAAGYNAHRPLWKAEVAGSAGRVLYVSSQTGAVVLDTTASERFWNWLGSVPHWTYFTTIREDGGLWRQIILWLSGPCIIAAITGIWIGILRVRLGKKRFKGGRITPYRGWMKWHHLTGLAGGLFLLLWIFSGWLSVDPGNVFSSERPGVARQAVYAGRFEPHFDVARLAQIAPEAQSISLRSAAGNAFYHIEQAGAQDRILDADTLTPPDVGEAQVSKAVALLFPGNSVATREVLTRPDAYWSAVNEEVPLPVLRLKLDDRAATWVHADSATGEIYRIIDRRGRIYRWLYTAFHRWDLPILLEYRPARDVVIWLFSLIGLATSVTGVWIGWQRLRRRPARSNAGSAARSAPGSTRATPGKPASGGTAG